MILISTCSRSYPCRGKGSQVKLLMCLISGETAYVFNIRKTAVFRMQRPVISGSPATIDDSTPVSQSRHTLRFQPIACRRIIRCPRVLRTRPEMVWQAFVHVVRWRCSTWQKSNQENGIAQKKKKGSLAILTFVWVFPHQNMTVTGLPARGRDYFCIRLHHLFGSLARLPKRGGAYTALWSGLLCNILALEK